VDWDAIGAVAEVLGAIGVLVTLLYLAIQIRANSREVRDNTVQSVLGKSVDLIARDVANPDFFKFVSGTLEHPSDSQKDQIFAWLMRTFQLFELVYLQSQKGRIDDEIMQAYQRRIANLLNRPTTQEWWPQSQFAFTDSFQEFIEGLRDPS
jgi:hypothetical protein